MKLFIRKLTFFIIILLCFTNTQCDDDDNNDTVINNTNCDATVVIDETLYTNLESSPFTFNTITIEGDCLQVEVSASGCDASSWQLNLIDSGSIAESFPEQRYLKLQLINNEVCLAVFSKTISVDIEPLQINNSGEIILNVENYNSPISYTY